MRVERRGIVVELPEVNGTAPMSVEELLANVGTVLVVADRKIRTVVGRIAGLYAPAFEFEINVNQQRFNVIRNGSLASVEIPASGTELVHLFARWNPDSIDVSVLPDKHDALPDRPPIQSFQHGAATAYTIVPSTIVQWARENRLLPKPAFQNSAELHAAMRDAIASLQRRLDDNGARSLFWANGFEKPKSEPEATKYIKALLDDLMLVNGVTLHQQVGAAGGSLDFLAEAFSKEGRRLRCCIEAKKSDANDVIHGIKVQLPAYMAAQGADSGIYLVLDYFERDRESAESLEVLLYKASQQNITTVFLDLSKPMPPSKRTAV
jgi:hypothetical protein